MMAVLYCSYYKTLVTERILSLSHCVLFSTNLYICICMYASPSPTKTNRSSSTSFRLPPGNFLWLFLVCTSCADSMKRRLTCSYYRSLSGVLRRVITVFEAIRKDVIRNSSLSILLPRTEHEKLKNIMKLLIRQEVLISTCSRVWLLATGNKLRFDLQSDACIALKSEWQWWCAAWGHGGWVWISP